MSRGAKNALRIAATLYKGMPQAKVVDPAGGRVALEPTVELKKDERFNVKLEMSDPLAKKLAKSVGTGKVSISLEALNVDLQHNQSFGMVRVVPQTRS